MMAFWALGEANGGEIHGEEVGTRDIGLLHLPSVPLLPVMDCPCFRQFLRVATSPSVDS